MQKNKDWLTLNGLSKNKQKYNATQRLLSIASDMFGLTTTQLYPSIVLILGG